LSFIHSFIHSFIIMSVDFIVYYFILDVTISLLVVLRTGGALLENNEALHSLPLQMAERSLRAQPDSVANHATDRSISDWRALT